MGKKFEEKFNIVDKKIEVMDSKIEGINPRLWSNFLWLLGVTWAHP